jgi:hypothetical protein
MTSSKPCVNTPLTADLRMLDPTRLNFGMLLKHCCSTSIVFCTVRGGFQTSRTIRRSPFGSSIPCILPSAVLCICTVTSVPYASFDRRACLLHAKNKERVDHRGRKTSAHFRQSCVSLVYHQTFFGRYFRRCAYQPGCSGRGR